MPPGHKLSCDSRCGPDMYSPDCPFPEFEAAISRPRKFRPVTSISADELGVVIEHQQLDGSIRALRYLSRTTLDNERK